VHEDDAGGILGPGRQRVDDRRHGRELTALPPAASRIQ
jgi:hypothetical protein